MSSELAVEVRDLGGASKHASAHLAADLSEAVSKTRFLGRAEVPLAATLSAASGAPTSPLCRVVCQPEPGSAHSCVQGRPACRSASRQPEQKGQLT